MQKPHNKNRKHDWPALVAEWEQSKLSKTEFCKQKQIAISGLYKARQAENHGRFVKAKVENRVDHSLVSCVIDVPGKMRISLQQVSPHFIRALIND